MNEYQDQIEWFRVRCADGEFVSDYDTREQAEGDIGLLVSMEARHADHTHSVKRMWGQA